MNVILISLSPFFNLESETATIAYFIKLFCIGLGVCVCVCACLCVYWIHVSVRMHICLCIQCGNQSRAFSVFSDCSLRYCLATGSLTYWKLTVMARLAIQGDLKSASLCPTPTSGVIYIDSHFWHFMWLLGIWTQNPRLPRQVPVILFKKLMQSTWTCLVCEWEPSLVHTGAANTFLIDHYIPIFSLYLWQFSSQSFNFKF